MSWPTIHPAEVPEPPAAAHLRLEPLHPRHNERDHAAWMSSIDHITATPGFGDGTWGDDRWPFEMDAAANLGDLEMHWREFERGEAYAYSVLDPGSDDVIGCVYVDPDVTDRVDDGVPRAMVRSWVRATHADLDAELVEVVDTWLATAWPFAEVRWPGRDVTRRG
ncbi:MAG: N-acetyltransferase [Actinomycetes bacterium]|jgi:hypothetical protein